jgi:hypothetical protein
MVTTLLASFYTLANADLSLISPPTKTFVAVVGTCKAKEKWGRGSRPEIVAITRKPLRPPLLVELGGDQGEVPAVLLAEGDGILLAVKLEGRTCHILQRICRGRPSN